MGLHGIVYVRMQIFLTELLFDRAGPKFPAKFQILSIFLSRALTLFNLPIVFWMTAVKTRGYRVHLARLHRFFLSAITSPIPHNHTTALLSLLSISTPDITISIAAVHLAQTHKLHNFGLNSIWTSEIISNTTNKCETAMLRVIYGDIQ